MKPLLALPLLLAASMLAAGCGGGDSESHAAARCVSVGDATRQALAVSIVAGDRVGRIGAVRSSDFKRVYFVSAEILGDGLSSGDAVGTWATNDLDEPAGFFAVDGYAEEFSDWGPGGSTDAHLSMSDDGADASRHCLR